MQSREVPRIVSADLEGREAILDEDHPRGSRFTARLDFVKTTRRLDWLRLALGAIVAVMAVSAAWYGGTWALRGAVAWLHQQPKYQLTFTDIELTPPVPDWLLGGKRKFLDEVLKRSGEDPVLSVPSLERGRLEAAFKKSPWVHAVREIRYGYPNQVVVTLDYCQPVVAVKGNGDRWFILDENGTILPDGDIDSQKVALSTTKGGTTDDMLIQIGRKTNSDPKDRSPGKFWRSSSTSPESEAVDRRILGAAKLGGFFKRKERSLPSHPKALRIYQIHINEGDDRGLFVFTSELVPFLWGPAPGEEPVGSLSAEEKWEMMRSWAEPQPHPIMPQEKGYLIFDRAGLRANSVPSAG